MGQLPLEATLMSEPYGDAWTLLELAAAHYGDRLAVVDQDRMLSYNKLAIRARALAGWLVEQGVRRGSHVGVMTRNSSFVMEIHFAAAYLHAGAFK
jgi:acyl-CoA synthetase (AMP-forming)/AMP-acid ligase II